MLYLTSHINTTAKLIVGFVFLFSGLVKLNDPVGFSHKIREYLQVLAAPLIPSARILLPYTLPLALALTTLECVLGVALLIGFQITWTLYALLSLTLFFAGLTLYTAISRRMASCGCLGHAMKLTPWQSFGKNIGLLLLLGWLYIHKIDLVPSVSDRIAYYGIIATALLALAIGGYTTRYLPLVDPSPYTVGNDMMRLLPDGSISTADTAHTATVLEETKLLIVVQAAEQIEAWEWHQLKTLLPQLQPPVQPLLVTSSHEAATLLAPLEVPTTGWASALLLQEMLRANVGYLLLERGIILGKWNTHMFHHLRSTLTRCQLL